MASEGNDRGSILSANTDNHQPLSTEQLKLKGLIIESLQNQGFEFRDNKFFLPEGCDKSQIRLLHAQATQHKMQQRKNGLIRHESRLLKRIASGREVIPEKIKPKLVEVHPRTEDELLFRYASLHWSIPVSSGYGRRLRFLIVDQSNDSYCLLMNIVAM